MTIDTYRSISCRDLDEEDATIVNYNGRRVKSLGKTLEWVNIEGADIEAEFQVIPHVKKMDVSIVLGREFLKIENATIDYLNDKVYVRFRDDIFSIDMKKGQFVT